jgi:hypothetical protein
MTSATLPSPSPSSDNPNPNKLAFIMPKTGKENPLTQEEAKAAATIPPIKGYGVEKCMSTIKDSPRVTGTIPSKIRHNETFKVITKNTAVRKTTELNKKTTKIGR